ncbi:type VI secretion system-associated FHA domain protein TagH [Pseudomonas helleri]|uniref:type VI secretion system-associated FHA domain protein TagH n=1 Tax=Pseudomonas helleri TaxID=1608996 RepID=UPI002432539C|nr:type VI secretion system-associated FHA domain protein TagH [Pseudomonas helleri]
MELVFDLLDTRSRDAAQVMRKTFTEQGGTIGRNAACEWALVDSTRSVSNYHAHISYRDGTFFFTDTSTNGSRCNRSEAWLNKGQAQRIEHGDVFYIGDFQLRAQLEHELQAMLEQVGRPQPAGSIIPDDAFLAMDPLDPIKLPAAVFAVLEEPEPRPGQPTDWEQRVDFARIDYENLRVPHLIEAPKAPLPEPIAAMGPPSDEAFWLAFGAVLGVDLAQQSREDREALALKAAHLLKHSIGGLQQSLWTRSELKNQLRLARTAAPDTRQNPLTSSQDATEALGLLLAPKKPHQPSAEQVVGRAFRDVQAHQVALLSASRVAIRSSLEHFSPQQLVLRFERDGYQPWLKTSASRWRAFSRYHQALQQDDDWCERVLARDFAQAYDVQVRMISTLHNDPQG